MHHGGKTPKPTVCWSNSQEILMALDMASIWSAGHYFRQLPTSKFELLPGLDLNDIYEKSHTRPCKDDIRVISIFMVLIIGIVRTVESFPVQSREVAKWPPPAAAWVNKISEFDDSFQRKMFQNVHCPQNHRNSLQTFAIVRQCWAYHWDEPWMPCMVHFAQQMECQGKYKCKKDGKVKFQGTDALRSTQPRSQWQWYMWYCSKWVCSKYATLIQIQSFSGREPIE